MAAQVLESAFRLARILTVPTFVMQPEGRDGGVTGRVDPSVSLLAQGLMVLTSLGFPVLFTIWLQVRKLTPPCTCLP